MTQHSTSHPLGDPGVVQGPGVSAVAGAPGQSLAGRRVVIAGGRGFLGLLLAEDLGRRGATVTLLSRGQPPPGKWTWRQWDGRTVENWREVLDGADGLVNLAGRSVDCIKTADHRDEILRSRVESTRTLGEASRDLGTAAPPVWVQMSTAHIYGDPPTAVCDETAALGTGLAPEVGQAWETSLRDATQPHQREVRLRTSFVIGRDRGAGGGPLPTLARLARLGLGGRVGHGRQGFSWLHEADFAAIARRALTDASMAGPYLASSPQPVSQATFMQTLRRVVGMPVGLPAPAWLVRLGARLVLRTDPELAIYGRYVMPRRLLDDGFAFEFPKLEPALRDLLGR